MGFAVGGVGQCSAGFASYNVNDDLSISNCGRFSDDSAVIDYGFSVGVVTGVDSNSFTITWSTNDAGAALIHYIAMAGDDLQSYITTWQIASGTGAQAVTGVGFQPELVIHLLTSQIRTGGPQADASIANSVGVMCANGTQWTVGNYQVHGVISSVSEPTNLTSADCCMGWINGSVALLADAFCNIATFASMDEDGFTVTWATDNTGISGGTVFSLCLAGLGASAGIFNKVNSATPQTQAVTSVGITPEAVLLCSANLGVANGYGGLPTTYYGLGMFGVSLGAFDATSNACAVTTLMLENHGGYIWIDADRSDESDHALILSIYDGVSLSECHGESLDADGFTLDWTLTEARAVPILELALNTDPIAAPVLSGRALSSTEIILEWTAVEDVDGYSLERSDDGETGWAEIADTAELTYNDTNCEPATTYYYRVRGYAT
jgi:hypothetical protein